mgnify:CR=1 FL=1
MVLAGASFTDPSLSPNPLFMDGYDRTVDVPGPLPVLG